MRFIIQPSEGETPLFLAPHKGEMQVQVHAEELYPYISGIVSVVEENIDNNASRIESGRYWGDQLSIRDYDYAKYMGDLRGSFSLGTVTTPERHTFIPFYQTEGRLDKDINGIATHKGARYYVSVDSSIPPQRKLEIIREDIDVALRNSSEAYSDESYLQYLGMIDYIRNHLNTLYHSFTYQDRYQLTNREGYRESRNKMYKAMQHITQEYYLVMLGHKRHIDVDYSEVSSLVDEIITELNTRDGDNIVFKMPEIENPLKIINFADLVTEDNPDIKTIVGAPSGGTETAIVTHLMYSIKDPDTDRALKLLPISTHSASVFRTGEETTTSYIHEYMGNNRIGFDGQSVLFIDDNSNTGQTLSLAQEAIQQSGAVDVVCRVVEADPIRIQLKSIPGNLQLLPNPHVYKSS